MTTLIIDIFQFIAHKQVKWNNIKWDMCKSDTIFPYLHI